MDLNDKTLVAEDYDPETGITERFYYHNGKITIQRLQDIDEQARIVQAVRNEAPTNFTDSKNGLFAAANVPFVEMERWKTEHGFEWNKSTTNEKRAWLNSDRAKQWKVRNVKL